MILLLLPNSSDVIIHLLSLAGGYYYPLPAQVLLFNNQYIPSQPIFYFDACSLRNLSWVKHFCALVLLFSIPFFMLATGGTSASLCSNYLRSPPAPLKGGDRSHGGAFSELAPLLLLRSYKSLLLAPRMLNPSTSKKNTE